MEREPVESSNIRSIGYSESDQILEIEFHSGSVYIYHDVPADVHASLITADSIGSHFHYTIKLGPYRYERIE